MFEFIQRFEKGYDTRVGSEGARLCGGQKQRIALARVFLRPKLVILDEATSALDAFSEEMVQQLIDRILAEEACCTVILIAHRLYTVVNTDSIAVMDEGKLVKQGTHGELLQLNGLYSAITYNTSKTPNETKPNAAAQTSQHRKNTVPCIVYSSSLVTTVNRTRGRPGGTRFVTDKFANERSKERRQGKVLLTYLPTP